MMFPPAIVRIRVIEREGKKIRLWLPTFLLWPPMFVVAVAAIPFLLFLMILRPFIPEIRRFLAKIHGAVVLLCSLKGLRIRVEDKDDEVLVQIV